MDTKLSVVLSINHAFTFANLLFQQAIATDKVGEYKKAIESYDMAIKLDPNNECFANSGLFNNRGVTYYNMGDYKNAIESYDMAIKLDPNNACFFANSGFTYYNMGDYDKAIESFNMAEKLGSFNNALNQSPNHTEWHMWKNQITQLSPQITNDDKTHYKLLKIDSLKIRPHPPVVDGLKFTKLIGTGSFAQVWIGEWQNSSVAIKLWLSPKEIDVFKNEISILKTLPSHPNVIQIFNCVVDIQSCIVMEFCEKGSLDKLLYDKSQHINEDEMIRFGSEIASGLCYLHKNHIVHRDLAARNILLTASNKVKISDYGLSRVVESAESSTTKAIAPTQWTSPEGLKNGCYSYKSDVWSFGIVLSEIVNRHGPSYPDFAKSYFDIGIMIRDKFQTPTIDIHVKQPKLLLDLMAMCWNPKPEGRPTFDTICGIFKNAK